MQAGVSGTFSIPILSLEFFGKKTQVANSNNHGIMVHHVAVPGSGSDVDELVAERLEMDIQLVAKELVLLRGSGALDEVPWSVVKACGDIIWVQKKA